MSLGRMVSIRTVDMYWKDFVIHGIDAHWGAEKTRNKLLDAFRQEMLGQILMQSGYDNVAQIPDDKENERIARNVMDQTQKRWNSLVKRCRKYKETQDILKEEDLMAIDLNKTEETA